MILFFFSYGKKRREKTRKKKKKMERATAPAMETRPKRYSNTNYNIINHMTFSCVHNLFKMFPVSMLHAPFCWPARFSSLSSILFTLFPFVLTIFFSFSLFSLQYALLQIVVEACQKKRHCKFLASSRTMNNDPCPETTKFIEIAYKCRPCKYHTDTNIL